MPGNPTLLNLLKKYWKKIINYWPRKVNIDTTNCEKILIDPLAFNNAIYHDLLTLNKVLKTIGYTTVLWILPEL